MKDAPLVESSPSAENGIRKAATQPARGRSRFSDLFGALGLRFWDRRGTVDVVAFDPTGASVAVGGRNVGTGSFDDHGDVKLRDVQTGALLHQIAVPYRVHYLAWNRNALLLALGARSGRIVGDPGYTLFVFEIRADGNPVEVHKESFPFVPDRGFGFSGHAFVVAGTDELVIWDASTWTVTKRLKCAIESLAVAEESGAIALAGRVGEHSGVRVWATGKSKQPFEFLGRGPVALSDRGNLVVYGSPTSDVLMYRGLDPMSKPSQVQGSEGRWLGCTTSLDGQTFAGWTSVGDVRLWRCAGDEIKHRASLKIPRIQRVLPGRGMDTLIALTQRKVHMRVDPDGSSRAVGEDPGGVELWAISDGTLLHRFRHDAAVPHGNRLATYFGAGGEEVRFWDISGPRDPKLLWHDRWRNRSRSWVPLLE